MLERSTIAKRYKNTRRIFSWEGNHANETKAWRMRVRRTTFFNRSERGGGEERDALRCKGRVELYLEEKVQ